jgi:GNAT superfamily N-acetyltransferase
VRSPIIIVRPATPADVGVIIDMIRALAEYENLSEQCVAEAGPLCEHLFGPSPSAEVLIAEVDGSAAGFALFFQTYSTFLTRPGLWLEDLFVRPEHRRGGVGKALLAGVAQVAAHRGCGRVEWSVLDWNQPSIAFYQRLGARLMDEWTTCRVEGMTLAALARGGDQPVAGLRLDSSEVESQEVGYPPRAVVDRLAPGGRPARRAR